MGNVVRAEVKILALEITIFMITPMRIQLTLVHTFLEKFRYVPVNFGATNVPNFYH